ncbi:histidine kinase HHK3 [Penicillium concentricum]|uniref:histidine kinase n=1 Tax=Penicillium concentricum TaxID=293559 RepID=A0A9W9S7C6_9EURO|nr:histidine kinase HHK3 [Penicillium concentricum]KAJ5372720.1 histidine kinase HHK3 [Penicillium concentricum]
MTRRTDQISFFPNADASILTSKHAPPLSRPQTVGPILDPENLDRPISPWPSDIETAFYPKSEPYQPSLIPEKTICPDRYLRAFLAENERLRLSVLWYYTRDILQEDEFLSGLQEKAHFAQESTGWEFAVIGILDVNVYIRLATVGLELGILPRGETICAHTVTQPPGNVFLLPSLMEDWRFQECPYLERGGLRAYAGVPLRLQTESGDCVSLGSLCVASSKAEEPLTKAQHHALVRLGDWVVSDLVQCARARRQRERRRMSELLAKAQKETNDAVSVEPVFKVLRTTYPDAIVRMHTSRTTHVEFEGCNSIPVSELKNGLWEDVKLLDDFIGNSNHLAPPSTRPVRIAAAPCESPSGESLLIVASKDFHLVFDDVDIWFIQACAGILSQMWRQSLLAEAMKAKEKFFRVFSHQLRTPIHGILGSVELMAEELMSWDSTENTTASTALQNTTAISLREPFTYLNIIKSAGRDLTSIINNLITLNKWSDIAATDRHYAMHTLDELETEIGKEIVKLTSGDTRYNSSVYFTQNLPPSCVDFCTDLLVLRETLIPLVINAVQHTPQGVVLITASMHSDGTLIVDIEDNGRGIQRDHHRRIFEAYEKVDIHSTGAGLGLTIASKFASLIHGSIDLISSEIGHASHFRATFREIECGCLPPPQPLAVKLNILPSRFFKMRAGPGSVLLGDHVETFLIRNGFTLSDRIEDCFVILEAVPDLEQHQACLSQIPSGQVAICLVSIPEENSYLERSADNVVYVSGPFLTSTLNSALERAQNILMVKASQPCLPQPKAISQPSLAPLSKSQHSGTGEEAAIDSLTVESNEPSSNETVPPASHSDISVSLALNLTTALDFSSSSSSQPVTLIVDDNPVNLRIMEIYCKKRGLAYLSATDGLQAVEMFTQYQSRPAADETSSIQLIFMDLQMPVCGGIEATQMIRSLELQNEWRRSCLFVLTGQDSPADRKDAEATGADEFFVKPVSIKQLDRVVKRYFPAFSKHG